MPRKILLENPQHNPPKFLQQKSRTHFCRGAGPRKCAKVELVDPGGWAWGSELAVKSSYAFHHGASFLSKQLHVIGGIFLGAGLFHSRLQRAADGGWKTQGEEKTYSKTPPQTVFGPPHLRFVPPPFLATLCHFPWKRKRQQPDQPQILRPPKVVLESTLCSTFPPQIHVIRSPPLSRCRKASGRDPDLGFLRTDVRSISVVFLRSYVRSKLHGSEVKV